MKIKDAKLLTGLSAKTIRFYESEGLISVRRNSNAYRDYDEDNIKELKRIKILRQLEIPISKIREFKNGDLQLENILKEKLEELNKGELDIQSKKFTIEVLLKEVKKNPNADLDYYHDDFEYIKSEEFTEFLGEVKELSEISLTAQLFGTLMLSGPLLWLWLNITDKNYDSIGLNSIMAILSTVILTLTWRKYLKQPNKKTKGTASVFLISTLIIILTIAIFVGIGKLQEAIFVPKKYLMFMFKPPYSYLIFFFEVELIAFLISRIYKKVKNIELKWTVDLCNFATKNIVATILLNIALLYMCITGITVVTENKITDYSFYNPMGTTYCYEDISKVEAGFKGKKFGIFPKGAGEFYYTASFNDGNKVNFYQANSEFEDTYFELEIFDKLIINTGKVEKTSSKENYELCDLDKRYVDRFLKIIDNK
ncbi:MerR family transcriptional regulator [Clostridium sp. UBA7503]|uniref:MerR family transcriptional regulator n=1 Tax=Clostridium sp. UBA7503 TaxID=1946377 RepID=UPI0032180A73